MSERDGTFSHVNVDGWDDKKRESFPLQLTGLHYKARCYSTYGNVDIIQEAASQEMWINLIDAQSRGIENGDLIRIFNDRGEVHIPAKVTRVFCLELLLSVRVHGMHITAGM